MLAASSGLMRQNRLHRNPNILPKTLPVDQARRVSDPAVGRDHYMKLVQGNRGSQLPDFGRLAYPMVATSEDWCVQQETDLPGQKSGAL
jgi:hypothetical protein